MATVTMTEQKFPLPSLQDWITPVSRLGPLLTTYSAWGDPLSKQLIVWIRDTLDVASRFEGDMRKIETIAKERLQELRGEILVNEMDGTPLQEPLLEGASTWGKRDLEEYSKYNKLSPHDGQPMGVCPHEFAQEMISWMETFPSEPLGEVAPSSELALRSEQTMAMNLRTTAYLQMARVAMSCARLNGMQKQIATVSLAATQTTQTVKQQLAVEVSRAAERMDAHEKATVTRIEQIDHHHKEMTSSLTKAVAVADAKVGRLSGELDRSNKQVKMQEGLLGDLDVKLRAAQGRIAELESQLNDDDGWSCSLM